MRTGQRFQSFSRITTISSLLMLMTTNATAFTALHDGSNNPLTEGWTSRPAPTPSVTAGPITSDMGFDAWEIDDNGSAIGDALIYEQVLTPEQEANAANLGWTLTATVRATDSTGAGNPANFARYYDDLAGTEWYMFFERDLPGESLPAGPSPGLYLGLRYAIGDARYFAVPGDPDAYHEYRMAFNPLNGNADIWIDGSPLTLAEPFHGSLDPQPHLESGPSWGAGSSSSQANARYHRVEFTVVPEPNALGAIALTSMLIGLRPRRYQ